MKKVVFTRSELLAQTQIDEKTFNAWEKDKLVKPDGSTSDKSPFYSENSLERVKYIKSLLDLGYGLEEIQRIIKKVGLPKNGRNNEHVNRNEYLTVGGLAEQVGVSSRTIKHWEDKGIIEPDMRSEGGFRLYSGFYIYLCKLIKDLQLFGYSLEEIKENSDLFRDFLAISNNLEIYSKKDTTKRLEIMLNKIALLFEKMALFKEGIARWEDLMKKKRREIVTLKNQNNKRTPEGVRRKK
ncbi:MAG: MerR family transcriptional regulator [Candidatus Aminicenantes bacterium]|nr:MerR family transcriptional regulator [Candidatus Aminicenantes bacterium]